MLITQKHLDYHSKYGWGGRNCVCCGPAPRTRKKHDRMVKRRMRHKAKMNIRKELGAL